MVLADSEYKDHALALGLMLGHWGELETSLMGMTEYLFQAQGDNVNHFKTDFLYKEFFNIRSKIRLLKRLNNFFVQDNTLKDKIDELLSDADNLNNERNRYVHARWRSEAGYGETSNQLVRISLGPPNKITDVYKPSDLITSQDIFVFSAKIVKLSQDIEDLLIQVSPSRSI
jgi:hypothetical protein